MGSRQPKLILRENCVQDVSRLWEPRNFLEMGAGTGYMTNLFLSRGFSGACSDLGESNREKMRRNLSTYGERVSIVDEASALLAGTFDYLFAFEVLEHIVEDASVLGTWAKYLHSGGRVLISVPAHKRKFGRSDEITGHVRRYERDELEKLLVSAGFRDIQIVNYGFPLTEITRRVSNWLVRADSSYDGLTMEQRSIQSAQAKPRVITRALSVISEKVFSPFVVLQRLFYRWDLGDGYVATAIKT